MSQEKPWPSSNMSNSKYIANGFLCPPSLPAIDATHGGTCTIVYALRLEHAVTCQRFYTLSSTSQNSTIRGSINDHVCFYTQMIEGHSLLKIKIDTTNVDGSGSSRPFFSLSSLESVETANSTMDDALVKPIACTTEMWMQVKLKTTVVEREFKISKIIGKPAYKYVKKNTTKCSSANVSSTDTRSQASQAINPPFLEQFTTFINSLAEEA